MAEHKIYAMSFARVYPLYVAKAERKGRAKAEVDQIICWLTGYSQKELEAQIEKQTDFETFFSHAPTIEPRAQPDHRPHLRHPRGEYRGAADAGDTLSGQAD